MNRATATRKSGQFVLPKADFPHPSPGKQMTMMCKTLGVDHPPLRSLGGQDGESIAVSIDSGRLHAMVICRAAITSMVLLWTDSMSSVVHSRRF